MERFSISPRAYRRITFLAVAALATIVLTGAAVRLTGSGLGCTDWPNCTEGRLTPAEITDAPAMIEFVNRVFTGVVSVAVALAVLGSRWRTPRRRDLTLLSYGLVVGVAAQIILGGLVVRYELSPRLVMGHFLLSMVLVWNGVVLHHRAGEADGVERRPASGRRLLPGRVLLAAAAVVVSTGTVVTASGPHAGDEQAARLAFHLPDVARVHGISVVVLLALTIGVLWKLAREAAPRHVQVAGRVLLGVLVAQGAVGYTQYFTGVPVLLVGIHIVGATSVWIAVVWFDLVHAGAVRAATATTAVRPAEPTATALAAP